MTKLNILYLKVPLQSIMKYLIITYNFLYTEILSSTSGVAAANAI